MWIILIAHYDTQHVVHCVTLIVMNNRAQIWNISFTNIKDFISALAY